MKRFLALALGALLCLGMTACSVPSASAPPMAPAASSPSAAVGESAGSERHLSYDSFADGSTTYNGIAPSTVYTVSSTGGGSPYTRTDAKLIREANLTLESLDYDAAVAALDALVTRCGGYYGSSSFWGGNAYGGSANRSADYTIRVPADRYDEFFAAVGDVAHVVRRSESATDVGADYYDNELRLNTAKIKHERLLSLLEKADKMEDIITIESSLSQVQYEIDQLSGTLRRYDGLIDFATIQVSLAEVVRITEKPVEGDAVQVRIGKAFSGGMVNFGEGLAAFAEWVAYHFIGLVVLFAVVTVAVVLLRKKLRRDRRVSGPDEG